MQVITLLSDMGTADYYVGRVKGRLLSLVPGAVLTDITHAVPAGNIPIAAYALSGAYKTFPAGTIHMVAVNTNLDGPARHVAFKYGEHFFVGTDNGIFSLALDGRPDEVFDITRVDLPEHRIFPAASLFPEAIAGISQGQPLSAIGHMTGPLLEKTLINPVIDATAIRGTVIYVDRNGNVITNITQDLFEGVRKNRKFRIFLPKSHYQISSISQYYTDFMEGEIGALFNSNGLLELAQNAGDFSRIMGLHISSIIRIEFYD